ncbi:1-acyl-sn-glycerol-3-phosphate acyltransferase, partial [Deltaproteobacteria bacterium]|nr:1-acyl-sn-glycerol-3-phosphate acyltransferase [Deltaproteobacteria bacterium]
FVLRLTKAFSGFMLYPFFRIQVAGLENIPEKGSFILLPKHQQWEDIPILGLAFQKPLYYIAKYELFERPVSKWLLSSLGGIPLNRERPLESRQSLKMMIRLLGDGAGVVIFPEGSCYREKMGPGHAGLIRMIFSRFSIPFIPVGIRYSKKRWRAPVSIEIGRPFHGNSFKTVNEIMDYTINEIARLSGLS